MPTSSTKMRRTWFTGAHGHSNYGTCLPKGSRGLSFIFKTKSLPFRSKRHIATPLAFMTSSPVLLNTHMKPASQILETLVSGWLISATWKVDAKSWSVPSAGPISRLR